VSIGKSRYTHYISLNESLKASSSKLFTTTTFGSCGSGPNPNIGPDWLIPGGLKNGATGFPFSLFRLADEPIVPLSELELSEAVSAPFVVVGGRGEAV